VTVLGSRRKHSYGNAKENDEGRENRIEQKEAKEAGWSEESGVDEKNTNLMIRRQSKNGIGLKRG